MDGIELESALCQLHPSGQAAPFKIRGNHHLNKGCPLAISAASSRFEQNPQPPRASAFDPDDF